MERYESLGAVGEGSYGIVLKCRHRDSGRLVAIKKFMDSDDDKMVKKIALREIKLLRKLRHDNLVNLLEAWKRRRRWYLVFEFVDRTLLDDLEQNPNGLDLNTSRQYLYQILRAAAFCHQQNIIHRDIKPENILISQGGVIKLCDFGFARTMASASEGTIYTDYVATRWYRAPELLVGDTKYGKPVDVWAIGCLLLEMLTGQPLFPGDSDLDQIYHIIRCFGNLTSHHQELFYRNPVFSGARLPEFSGRVPLWHRFPTITPTTLDLAESCLEMDPERRAQCSELLEHPLFTQDSFHIRFLDELNAKIQNDHRENSTLPKITKTSRPERDDGDEKNRKGKDKKQPDDVDEKVNRDKTKGKQPLKLSKTTRNTSESLTSTKPPKTVGNRVVHNAAQSTIGSKAGKVTGAEVTSDSSETAKTVGDGGSDQSEHKVPEKCRTRSPSEDRPTEERTKVLPSNPKPPTLNSAPKMSKNTSLLKTLTSGFSAQSSKAETPENLVQVHHASSRDYEENPESSEPSCHRKQSMFKSKISTEARLTSTSVSTISAGTMKALTVSDKENREDLAPSVSVSTRTESLLQQSQSTERKTNSNYLKSGGKSLNIPHNRSSVREPKMKTGSFSNHKRSTDARKRSDITNTSTATSFSSATSTSTPDHKASTAGSVTHSTDAAGLRESVFRGPHLSTPPPPPPPSSTPLLVPPSSTSLTPSFCVVNTSSPPVSDHFTMGTGFHSGTHSIRCVDKPKYHGGMSGRQTQHVLSSQLSGSLTFQAPGLISERSFLSDRCNLGNSSSSRSKPHIHFPDVRSSMLLELRGREGKHNKGTTKDPRKHPAPSGPASEAQQHGHDSTDTNTPKQT